MATNPRRSAEAANAAANAMTALLNGGTIVFYDGSQPASVATEITSQSLLASATFSNTAFGSASNGVATANAITGSAIVTSGNCAWFRAYKSDGTTAVWDGTVGTANADCIVPTTTFTRNVMLLVTSVTITEAM